MNTLSITFMLAILFYIPITKADAECTPNPGSAVANANSFSLSTHPHLPPGTLLAPPVLSQETRSMFNCSQNAIPVIMRFRPNPQLQVSDVQASAPFGDGGAITIFEINKGLGFALGVREITHCGGEGVKFLQAGQTSLEVCRAPDDGKMETQYYISFFKTSNELASDTPNNQQFNAGVIYLTDMSGNEISGGGLSIDVAATNISVRHASCYVTDTQIYVNLGKVTPSDISRGVASKTPFSIPLKCDASQREIIKVGFFGQATPEDHNILALSNVQDSARGVGIQLSYGASFGSAATKTVNLNSTDVESTNSDSSLNLTFDAQYIATGQVSPGKADAIATFNIIYN